MKILFQTNNRKIAQLEHEHRKLVESGYEIVPFGYLYDGNKITFTGLDDITSEDNILLRSSIRVLRELAVNCIEYSPNNLTSLKQTLDYYLDKFEVTNFPESEHFLNKQPGEYEIQMVCEVLDKKYGKDVFIKPINDLKLFSGTLIPKGQTLRSILEEKNELERVRQEPFDQVLVSHYCPLLREEVRCYVVDSKVVTISRYRYEGKYNTDPLSPDVYKFYQDFAQNIIDTVYKPGNNFTIDLCTTSTFDVKVVEYNCLTSSGLYECNTKDLFSALERYYYGNN